MPLLVVATVVVLLLVLDILVYFFGCDSRDGARSDEHERYATWIEEASERRAEIAAAVTAPARHVGSLARGDARRVPDGRLARDRRGVRSRLGAHGA